MALVKAINEDVAGLQMQSTELRLAESEQMLHQVTESVDKAYWLLSQGDSEKSQLLLGQLINALSEHFYDELH